jgi:hypothetical protein
LLLEFNRQDEVMFSTISPKPGSRGPGLISPQAGSPLVATEGDPGERHMAADGLVTRLAVKAWLTSNRSCAAAVG